MPSPLPSMPSPVTITGVDVNSMQLQSSVSGYARCADVGGSGSTGNNAWLHQWDCANGQDWFVGNQRLTLTPVDGNWYRVSARHCSLPVLPGRLGCRHLPPWPAGLLLGAQRACCRVPGRLQQLLVTAVCSTCRALL